MCKQPSHKVFMLAGILSIFFLSMIPNISLSQSDAGKSKTWIIDKSEQYLIPAPPDERKTKSELNAVNSSWKKDEKTLWKIKYWDAGPPSYRWNQIACSLVDFLDFPTFLRTPSSWMHLAIYDATVLTLQAKNKYQRKRPSVLDPSLKPAVRFHSEYSYPCEHSVTASAAAHVLAYFYPKKADSLLKLAKEAAQSRIDAGVQYQSDIDAGWKLGEQIAMAVIEKAKKDGSDIQWKGTIKNDPNLWRGDYPFGITATYQHPILLKTGDQFRPPPPPDFAEDMGELKNFKRNFQSENCAYYWARLNGIEFWNDAASRKMFEYRMDDDALACAKIYAVLNTGMHDAAIAIMDAKYAYWGIRPFQYDSTYKPLIPTPPFPGYPSGHATASSMAATILERFFPGDAKEFQHNARECAESRFYAGIHFRTDNETGLQMGKKMGNYVVDAWNKK